MNGKRKYKTAVLANTVGAGLKPARFETEVERAGLKPAPTKDLPAGWEWKTLGAVAEVVGGGTPRTNDPANFEGGSIPWVTPADLSGYTSKKIGHGSRYITEKGLSSSSARLLPEGSVLFTSRAPIGYVAIASNTISTNQGFKNFVLKKGVLPDYVYWYLKGSKDLAESLASGTTFLELSGAKAKQLPIPLAPFDQQKQIVSEIEKQFSRLDEAVAALKRIKANLKRYKASVLKAAVEGKLTEEWRLSARAENRRRAQVDELENISKAKEEKWFVYIIECDNQSFYVGHSSDLHARWKAHCDGKAADWTHQHTPKYLIHFEVFDSKEDAVKREKNLKTGFGRTWRKREIAAGRMKPIVHNPENETALPVHDLTASNAQAGVQTGEKLLKRILAERKKKWEEKNPGKKYKEPVEPDTSNLPDLPKGWVWAAVGQISESMKNGIYKPRDSYSANGVACLRMYNIEDGRIVWKDIKRMTLSKTEIEEYKLLPGDLLVNRVNSRELVGKAAPIPEGLESCVFESKNIRVRFQNEFIDANFVSYIFSVYGQAFFNRNAQQVVGMASISQPQVSALPVPLPSFTEQKSIVKEVERCLSVTEEIEKTVETNLKRAERLRQAILKKAFSGRLIPAGKLN